MPDSLLPIAVVVGFLGVLLAGHLPVRARLLGELLVLAAVVLAGAVAIDALTTP